MAHWLRPILWSAAVVLGAHPRIARAQSAAADAFRHRLTVLYSVIAQADTAALRPHLADDLRWVIGTDGSVVTKAQLLAAAARPQVPAPHFQIDSVRAQRIGNVALVEYLRSDHRRVGSQDFSTRWRVLDVFVAQGGRWQLARHTQMWIVTPVVAIAADSAVLQPFVGRYQILPGYVDDVHWERGQLVATASGQAVGAHLVPVSTSAFSPDGVGALMVFERDAGGRVLGYVQGYPDGRVIHAVRLP